jgi:thiol-disulfide isomerase/thioredoxin|tara:strand:- start:848 stop:1465 length:618 start_codon:yes stop_codon:yes gene_type:complete
MKNIIVTILAITLFGVGCTAANDKDSSRVSKDTNTTPIVTDTDLTDEPQNQESDSVVKTPVQDPVIQPHKIIDVGFKDYNGNDIKLSDLLGKPLVVNSWAVWCPFCVKELPDFVKVQKELGDKVTIISINRQESKSRTDEFLTDLGVRDGLTFWLDSGDKFYQTIGGFSMPETILIDVNGQLVDHKRGTMDDKELRKRIKENLGI